MNRNLCVLNTRQFSVNKAFLSGVIEKLKSFMPNGMCDPPENTCFTILHFLIFQHCKHFFEENSSVMLFLHYQSTTQKWFQSYWLLLNIMLEFPRNEQNIIITITYSFPTNPRFVYPIITNTIETILFHCILYIRLPTGTRTCNFACLQPPV